MFFRFGSALVLVVLISLAGVALEKKNLELRRAITRQRYRMDVMRDLHAQIRLETQRLASPANTIDSIERSAQDATNSRQSAPNTRQRMPLLRWQQSISR